MSEKIRVSKKVKRELIKIMGELQIERGEKVEFNDVIEFFIERKPRDFKEFSRNLT